MSPVEFFSNENKSKVLGLVKRIIEVADDVTASEDAVRSGVLSFSNELTFRLEGLFKEADTVIRETEEVMLNSMGDKYKLEGKLKARMDYIDDLRRVVESLFVQNQALLKQMGKMNENAVESVGFDLKAPPTPGPVSKPLEAFFAGLVSDPSTSSDGWEERARYIYTKAKMVDPGQLAKFLRAFKTEKAATEFVQFIELQSTYDFVEKSDLVGRGLWSAIVGEFYRTKHTNPVTLGEKMSWALRMWDEIHDVAGNKVNPEHN